MPSEKQISCWKRMKGSPGRTLGKHWKRNDVPWNKGLSLKNGDILRYAKPRSIETRKKLSMSKTGERNSSWKDGRAWYYSVHNWVKRWKGKAGHCEMCGLSDPNRKYNWANRDHEYKRILEDYISMCIPCHKKYDKKLQEKNTILEFLKNANAF